MGDDKLWFGFLEAGEKSAPVAVDRNLDTGMADTVYVYNHKRGQILEYKREIIEPKLRELKASERDLKKQLESGFKQARKGFLPRSARLAAIPERAEPAAREKTPSEDEDMAEGFEDDVMLDDDADDEEEDY